MSSPGKNRTGSASGVVNTHGFWGSPAAEGAGSKDCGKITSSRASQPV